MLVVVRIWVRITYKEIFRWPNKNGNQGMEFEIVCRRSKIAPVQRIELLQVLRAR